MADRTYRSDRNRYDRDRRYNRQAEQFDTTDHSWRDDERGYGQMGEGWRDEDYGQYDTGSSYSRDREVARDWGRDPSYRSGSRFTQNRGFGSFTGSDQGGRDFNSPRFTNARSSASSYGAGSQLAANHGEWRDYGEYGANPSRENRDYRGTWGGRSSGERGWFDRASDTVASWFGDEDAERRHREDYRGHGPAGYTRSDERIKEDANDRLTDDWGVDARQITVSVSNGEVTLDGTVPSREQKRRAEDVIDELSGVKNVQNNLRVQERTSWDRNNSSEFGSKANSTSTEV